MSRTRKAYCAQCSLKVVYYEILEENPPELHLVMCVCDGFYYVLDKIVYYETMKRKLI